MELSALPEQLQLFQFHYGTIKRMPTLEQVKEYFEFQFHYGTIKSAELFNCKQSNISFQFHYGTIKSVRRNEV